ncbi:hypothetical protein AXG93_1864s1190 [Marchantia polymorpha subsp. ruderalis]|uniref:Starch synthase, chloroplastic/amyloplastic n=1 Tax=Marchantia polymorpha subsp. ruderalis TaxID=1480154 RepID=A0A176WRT8_MARPO|nr:hypothetical protein AXG93_1864s1190 [Marchantia polymorpha subsp. ruderalis]
MAHLLSWAQGIVPNPRSPGVHHDNVHCQGSFKSVPTWAGRATVLYQPKSGDSCSNSLLRNSRAIRFSATSRPDSQGRTDATSVEPVETTEGRIAKLLAANERLLARIADLEKVVNEVRAENAGYIEDKASATPVASSSQAPNAFKSPEPGISLESDSGTGAVTVENSSLSQQPLPAAQEATLILSQLANIRWPSPNDEVPFWMRKSNVHDHVTSFIDNSGAGRKIEPDKNPLYIVHVTAELAPVAKVGGLGDVVTGLGRTCMERGHKVLVMLPFYESIDTTQVEGLAEAETFSSFHKGSWLPVKSFHGKVAGVPVLLIRTDNNLFKGSQIYGGDYDEMEAYLFFSRACLERMQVTGDQPDVIHIHEWHTGVLAMLYWDMYNHLSLKKPRIVLTIHNMEHYGECRVEQLNMCGLDGSAYGTIDRAIDERTIGHNPERLSLLKGGIVYSNAVTTVSPTYANETLCSGWLANTLLRNRSKYFGILNGIDTTVWDPASDPCLPMQYNARKIFGKLVCKQYVQRGLGLEADDLVGDGIQLVRRKQTPLVICITRLVAQKGIHLIRHAINQIGERGGQFVLLGTAPDPRVQAEFEQMSQKLQTSKNIRLLTFYSEDLAHKLYAAGDIVLVPSMFEPCGLTQMIGMRYGAIPVVRRTGGLADTVFDIDDPKNKNRGNGFVFDGISEDSLDSALNRALTYHQERREWWQDLTARVMELDHSWNKSAAEYLNLYNNVRVG